MTMNVALRLLTVFALAGLLGCQPKAKEITDSQRKEAANHVSEAEFALTLRDYARAEPLYTKATELCPDNAQYFVNLGAVRKQLGKTREAKSAYESALKVQQQAYARDPKNGGLVLEQVYLLAVLGRTEEARAALKKGQAVHTDDQKVRGF